MPRATRSGANDEEASTVAPSATSYLLRLYVAGETPKSLQAIQTVKDVCVLFPRGRCKYEVIDLPLAPGLPDDNVVAVPCFVKVHPLPRTSLIGITTDVTRMLLKLGLPTKRDGRSTRKNR